MTPIIKNARVATLAGSRQVSPRRNTPPGTRLTPQDSLASAAYEEGYRAGHEQGSAAGRELGHQQGRDEGLQAGLQQGRQQVLQEREMQQQAEATRALVAAEANAASLQALHACLQQSDAALQARAEALAVDIAWTALMRLLGDAVGKRETVCGMVRAVLGQTRSPQVLRICLAPGDLELLKHGLPTDFEGFSLASDARVQAGGCIVETVGGALDGRLETQLNALRQLLVSRLASGTEPR